MDDLQERLQLYERALFELVRNVHSLGHSVEAIRACLIASSLDPDETKKLLDVGDAIAPQLDPARDVLDQIEAHLEILAARKTPSQSDT